MWIWFQQAPPLPLSLLPPPLIVITKERLLPKESHQSQENILTNNKSAKDRLVLSTLSLWQSWGLLRSHVPGYQRGISPLCLQLWILTLITQWLPDEVLSLQLLNASLTSLFLWEMFRYPHHQAFRKECLHYFIIQENKTSLGINTWNSFQRNAAL